MLTNKKQPVSQTLDKTTHNLGGEIKKLNIGAFVEMMQKGMGDLLSLQAI